MTIGRKAPKSLQMSFRVTERFRNVLIGLADRENRSQANMLEVAIYYYADSTGLEMPVVKPKAPKKRATNKI